MSTWPNGESGTGSAGRSSGLPGVSGVLGALVGGGLGDVVGGGDVVVWVEDIGGVVDVVADGVGVGVLDVVGGGVVGVVGGVVGVVEGGEVVGVGEGLAVCRGRWLASSDGARRIKASMTDASAAVFMSSQAAQGIASGVSSGLSTGRGTPWMFASTTTS